MSAHAKLSPSSSKRWRSCPASIAASEGIPRKSSAASRSGTAEHLVSSVCLERGLEVAQFLNTAVVFYAKPEELDNEHEALEAEAKLDGMVVLHRIVIDEDSAARCEAYVSYVREQVALTGSKLLVEQKLPIGHITGEVDATGTGDAILINDDTITVIDAKFGSGRVDAAYNGEPNSQLAIYAAGALEQFGWTGSFKTVQMVIVQPRINHVSEHSMTIDDLLMYSQGVKIDAGMTRSPFAPFNPTNENCFFCPAKLNCKAREDAALEAVFGDFDNLDTAPAKQPSDDALGTLYSKLGFIRKFCDDVEARVFATLDNGKPVVGADGVGYKIVDGRKGNRQWRDEQEVIDLLEGMSIHESVMFTKKLISPTAAEKLAGGRKPKNVEAAEKLPIGPTRWKRLQELVIQPEGKPEVVLETDPRPCKHALDDFQCVQTLPADAVSVDLF